MDEAGAGTERERLRGLLPDEPRWLEPRGLLGYPECPLHVDLSALEPSFIVVDDVGERLAAIIGRPNPELIRRAVRESQEVLAYSDNLGHVCDALPEWESERAALHVLPSSGALALDPVHPTRYLEAGEVAAFSHLDPDLRRELAEADEEDIAIVAALAAHLPVAFCYAGATSERLWDVAVDTAESHRRLGYAASAVMRLIRDNAARGLSPVWGAVESNAASLGLARKLGFVEVDALWVLRIEPAQVRGAPA